MPSILERAKLFETVKNLHDAGTVKLSDKEIDQITRETSELVTKSIRNKSAAKAPEGFEEIIHELSGKDPDEVFEIVVNFDSF